MIGDLQYIYIYIYISACMLSICLHKSSSEWKNLCPADSRHTVLSSPAVFGISFLQLNLQNRSRRCASQAKKINTHTQIYIYIYTYIYTPWEPLKPSFLGLSAHISRAEKRSFFMGFGVQRHIHGETWCVCGLFHPSSHKVKNSSQDKDHQAGPDSGTCVLCMYYKAHSE